MKGGCFHEAFDNPATVNGILSGAGHTPTVLSAAQVESGQLLSGANPAFDVFVISRRTTFLLGGSLAYANAVHDYIDAGGNIVTEWSGGNMFFSSYAGDIRSPADNQPQLATFQGIVHSGHYNGSNTPINILNTAHPTVAGIPNPFMEGGGTEFFFWIEDPDPALEVVADFVGNGWLGFPLDEDLPTLLVGCSDASTFVIGTWDWNDTLSAGLNNALFLTNAVDYAAESGACGVEASIDIKFCSNPNAFNCEKNGVLPVTIFGTDSFDVQDIDVSTLQLCTEDLSACVGPPRNYSIADRGDPTADLGAAMCTINPETGDEEDFLTQDEYLDLDAAFEATDIQEMLGVFCSADKGAVSESLVLTGETYDGTLIYSVPIGSLGIDQLLKQH